MIPVYPGVVLTALWMRRLTQSYRESSAERPRNEVIAYKTCFNVAGPAFLAGIDPS